MLAGFSVSDITPSTGTMLNGFIARLTPSTGVDAPLYARALWLEDAGAKSLIVGLDVLGVSSSFADRMILDLASRLDLPEEQVILASSHTHSGPMTIRLRGLGTEDQTYLSVLAERILEASTAAAAKKAPVQLSWGSAPIEIGVNRRQVDPEDGTITLGFNADGPKDSAVRVMHLVGDASSIILFEHACHPYFLGADCSLISPDFWGHTATELEKQGHQAIYLNGCAGDLAPLLPYRGPQTSRREAGRLARAVLNACDQAQIEEHPDLRAHSSRFDLPRDTLPERSRIESDLKKDNRTVRPEEKADQEIQVRLSAAWDEWLSELKRFVESGSSLPSIPARVSVLRIGRGTIIALPGEVFYEIGQGISARLQADPVCVSAYCHGYLGYIPTAEAFVPGGYEVEEAHRYTGLWRASPLAGALLEREVVRLWNELGD